MKLWPTTNQERLNVVGYCLLLVIALSFAVAVLAYEEPACLEIHMELEPAPAPEPPPARPPAQASMGAGELVAFWKQWEKCEGDHCID